MTHREIVRQFEVIRLVRTCFSSLMFNLFMSEGYLTESSMGLDAGPAYGGPGTLDPSAI
jgi:hypothetical protein